MSGEVEVRKASGHATRQSLEGVALEHFEAGMDALSAGRFDAAVEALRAASAAAPSHALTRSALGLAIAQSGDDSIGLLLSAP